MNSNERIDEILDDVLRRLSTPSRESVDAARERIRENVRNTNAGDMTPLSLVDTRPVSLWGLRLPFLIVGGGIFAFAVLTATTFWILPERSPAASVPSVPRAAVEPAPPAPAPAPTAVPEIVPRTSGTKAVKRREPKRAVEEVQSPEQALTSVRPAAPGAVLVPEPIDVQSDGDPRRAVLDRVCTACHSLRGIEAFSYSSPDAYKDLVSDMISRGAVISDEEMTSIVEYLYKTYGQK
jgi:hypothetical protein